MVRCARLVFGRDANGAQAEDGAFVLADAAADALLRVYIRLLQPDLDRSNIDLWEGLCRLCVELNAKRTRYL